MNGKLQILIARWFYKPRNIKSVTFKLDGNLYTITDEELSMLLREFITNKEKDFNS